MVLHRTRPQGLMGLQSIPLGNFVSFLELWPQWDELRFVEIMMTADQYLMGLLAKDQEDKEDQPEGNKPK